MRDLFKKPRSLRPYSFCQIIHVRTKKLIRASKSGVGMHRTRIITNRDRSIEMPVHSFKLLQTQKACEIAEIWCW